MLGPVNGGRSAWIGAGLLALALGCGNKEVSDSGNPFGTTSGTGSTAPGTGEAGSSEAGSMGSASETSEPTTGSPTGEGSTSSASNTNGSTSDDPTTGMPGDSTGPVGAGQLGECVGTDAWASCAQYCEAILEQCVPGGCDGMTVVYYNDVGACQAMEADGGDASACADPFAGGGGISFARCCCT